MRRSLSAALVAMVMTKPCWNGRGMAGRFVYRRASSVSLSHSNVKIILQLMFSSAGLCHQNYCHVAGVHHPPSINSSFLKTAAWIQARFYGKLSTHYISRLFLARLNCQQISCHRNFVCRPSSACVAIISVPNVWTSFKFWLLLPLGHTLRLI